MINFEKFYCESSGGFCSYNGDCNDCSFYEPEYNLTIQQVLQHENVGKYFRAENDTQITFYLQEGEYSNLEFLIVEDKGYVFNEYSLAQEELFLTDIVDTMYKEVDYNVQEGRLQC